MGEGMPRTVLIADESVTIRSVAESLLRGESFSVHSAADGKMALELAQAEKPDLVLIGERMPGLSGVEVCAALKSDPSLQAIPIIFMRTDQPGTEPKDVEAVLTKPFSPQSLLEAVRRFLADETEQSAADPFAAVTDDGLEEELIDQALGLDDVGSVPAEEREVSSQLVQGGDEIRLEGEGAEDSDGALGMLGEEESERSEESIAELSVETDLESTPQDEQPASAQPESEVDLELDRALDDAFGGGEVTLEPAAESAPEPHSLDEVALGDTPESTVEAMAQEELSSATPGHSLDLGSDAAPPAEPLPETPTEHVDSSQDSQPEMSSALPDGGLDLGPDVEPQERPHDYDWFIKEMEKEASASSQTSSAPEPERPRIEPLVPQAEDESEQPLAKEPPQEPAAAVPPGTPGDTSEININVEEFEASQRGYDEFISEFRKEIAKLEGAVPPADPPAEEVTKHSQSGQVALEDSGVAHTPPPPEAADVRQIGDQLIDSVTQQVARELAAKIDSKVIYALIEQKLKEGRQDNQT
jgi:CheY-like chemotaxis protein